MSCITMSADAGYLFKISDSIREEIQRHGNKLLRSPLTRRDGGKAQRWRNNNAAQTDAVN